MPVRSSSESVVPETTSLPASIITTWSQTCCTSSSRWVAISTEMPNVPRRATSASISSRPSGSRPAVGSSSSTSSGSPTSAWASLVRWRMPVENPLIGRNRASSSPTRSRMSDARWRAARAGSPLSSPNVDTTSAAVWSSGRHSCSGMYPSRARTPIGSLATSMPHTSTRPSVGWARPSRRRNVVVLPAPLAPTRPIRPRGTSTVRSSRAVTPG